MKILATSHVTLPLRARYTFTKTTINTVGTVRSSDKDSLEGFLLGFVYYILPLCIYLVYPDCVSSGNIQIFLLNITYIAQMVTSSNNYLSVKIIPPISYVGLLWCGVKFKMNFNSITVPEVLQLLVLADCNELRS